MEFMSRFGGHLALAPVHLTAVLGEKDMRLTASGDLMELDRDERMTGHVKKQTLPGMLPIFSGVKSCFIPVISSERKKQSPGSDEAGQMNKQKSACNMQPSLGLTFIYPLFCQGSHIETFIPFSSEPRK